MKIRSRRSRRLRNPRKQEIEHRPFFSKTNDTAVQAKEEAPFFQTKLKIGQPGDKYEQEADAVANAVVNQSGSTNDVLKKDDPTIQRVTLATPLEEEKLGTKEAAVERDKEIQEKPELQAMHEEEEMAQMQGEEEEMAQMQGEEEEMAQMQGEEEEMAQMQGEEEEMAQMQGEEEEMAQMQGEEEEMAQMQGEEEEMAQMQGEEEEMAQMQGEEEEMAQTKKTTTTNQRVAKPQLARCLHKTKGKGRPLPEKTRIQMEKSFGVDLSHVLIHTDEDAEKMNKALKAQAFTNGRDIYFNTGKFNPETKKGQLLLAHELTHVLQQKALKP